MDLPDGLQRRLDMLDRAFPDDSALVLAGAILQASYYISRSIDKLNDTGLDEANGLEYLSNLPTIEE